MSSRQEKDKAVSVQVLVRCRPFSEEELRSRAPEVVSCNENQREVSVAQMIAGKQIDRSFTFDKVFGPSTKQIDLYNQAIAPMVSEVLEGFNCTIFAYGQTGTGKTYTMEGEYRRTKAAPIGQLPPGSGVIPRAVKQIFDTLESRNADYSVKVTFIELYNEEITDLLAPDELSRVISDERTKKSLHLADDQKGGVVVRGVEEEIVKNADAIYTLLERGSTKRHTAETLLNKQSSRSHSLFTITIHIKESTPEGEELIKIGKLNLVDLAGSENISRSGAREGRAREAGEINKSLLTLGRVITALTEHLGHVPYRDSKLTRLLRDSLGGRTKTCIIATVSPSVPCLEETLCTLDYAHRAKNIKNRPEVNQKLQKSDLIKDLNGQIEQLRTELKDTRDKVGVYIPNERYEQEEAERKAMTERIVQMGISIETNHKQIEELQEKYELELQHSSALSSTLSATEEALDHTSKLLLATREELKLTQYNLKEKDFIISNQKNSENALTHQAFVLRSDLEKTTKANSHLFSKISREEKRSADNRSVVNTFQDDLVSKLGLLSASVTECVDQQNKHLNSIEFLCKSSLDLHDKALSQLRSEVSASKASYLSHIELMKNLVRSYITSTSATLENITSTASVDWCSLDQLLALGEAQATENFMDLKNQLSTHRTEIGHLVQKLHERLQSLLEETAGISKFILDSINKVAENTSSVHSHLNRANESQLQSMLDFKKDFEEQSEAEVQKFMSDIKSLLSNYRIRQMQQVDAMRNDLGSIAKANNESIGDHSTRIEGAAKDAKRKWEEFFMAAEHDLKEASNFSAAKHCRMEHEHQKCISTVDDASRLWATHHASISEAASKQVSEMDAIIRSTIESNDQHDTEIAEARKVAERDAAGSSEGILLSFDDLVNHEHGQASRLLSVVDAHRNVLTLLQEGHSSQTVGINAAAERALHHNYKYEPNGDIPARMQQIVPSQMEVESLRVRPIEELIREFRENHPYESAKEPTPSRLPKIILAGRN